ncbi:MAG: hypothetical protein Q8N36_05290 [bacterium]|nr:hypothetical protein [bacterium]
MNSTIMVIKIGNRSHSATKVQELLTEYGCHIKTRVGFHHTSDDFCSEDGIIILQLTAYKETNDGLVLKLNKLPQVEAQIISFK